MRTRLLALAWARGGFAIAAPGPAEAASSGCGCAVGGSSGRHGAGALMALLVLAFLVPR